MLPKMTLALLKHVGAECTSIKMGFSSGQVSLFDRYSSSSLFWSPPDMILSIVRFVMSGISRLVCS